MCFHQHALRTHAFQRFSPIDCAMTSLRSQFAQHWPSNDDFRMYKYDNVASHSTRMKDNVLHHFQGAEGQEKIPVQVVPSKANYNEKEMYKQLLGNGPPTAIDGQMSFPIAHLPSFYLIPSRSQMSLKFHVGGLDNSA